MAGPGRARSTPTPRRRCTWPRYPVADEALIDPALSDPDGAGPPAGRARPGGAGRLGREDPSAAVPGAGLGGRLRRSAGRACWRRSPPSSTSARSLRCRARPDRWWTPRPRPTSGPLGKRFGKARAGASRPPIAAADAAALSDALRATGIAHRHRRRRDGHARPGRGRRHRDPARGLGGGRRGRRDRRARPAAHPGAAAGRARPGRDPADPGGPQVQRPGGRRPHRAALRGHRRTTPRPRSPSTPTWSPTRCWPPTSPPGEPSWAGAEPFTDEALGLDLLAPQGLMPEGMARHRA